MLHITDHHPTVATIPTAQGSDSRQLYPLDLLPNPSSCSQQELEFQCRFYNKSFWAAHQVVIGAAPLRRCRSRDWIIFTPYITEEKATWSEIGLRRMEMTWLDAMGFECRIEHISITWLWHCCTIEITEDSSSTIDWLEAAWRVLEKVSSPSGSLVCHTRSDMNSVLLQVFSARSISSKPKEESRLKIRRLRQ